MLKFLMALALVASSVECAAACTPAADAQPACHHHKHAPNQKACSHELAPATIVHAAHADVSFSVEAALAKSIAPIPVLALRSGPEQSPPGRDVPLRVPLRI